MRKIRKESEDYYRGLFRKKINSERGNMNPFENHIEKAEKIVDKIINDMTGRSGGDWWGYIDDDIQEEIRKEWRDIILELL